MADSSDGLWSKNANETIRGIRSFYASSHLKADKEEEVGTREKGKVLALINLSSYRAVEEEEWEVDLLEV